ncbi:MAG TPA: hypothetical protein DCG49_12350 [Ruminococcus sp.]|nr:hypothetical protein [Ruminococcus sp.]
MKAKQIHEMMRDIDPRFQQKADERAAAVKQRRSRLPILLGGGAAIACAAFTAVILLPSIQKDALRTPANMPDSGAEQITESLPAEEMSEYAEAAACLPIEDFSNDEIRLAAAAYAPYVLDLSAEQQRALSDALLETKWLPCDEQAPLADGESYSIFVYHGGDPYRLTAYANGTVVLEQNGEESRWSITEAALQAIIAAAATTETEGHLTWCAADTFNAVDIWKNTRVGAKQCDMTDKQDVFFKMNNAADYFDRCSAVVKQGCPTSMERAEFQVDLNAMRAYQHAENYYGPSAEALINEEDSIVDAHFAATDVIDGEYFYDTSDLMVDGTWIKYPNVVHRIDSPTVSFEDLRPIDPEGTEYDYWNSRRQLLNGIAVDCIENYRMVVDYLQDFDRWDIVGTEVLEGRTCVHIHGTTNGQYGTPAQEFDLYADEETGVTVKMLEYDASGNIFRFIIVEDLAFDDDAKPVTELDPEIRAGALDGSANLFDCSPEEAVNPADAEEAMVPEGAEQPVTEHAPEH